MKRRDFLKRTLMAGLAIPVVSLLRSAKVVAAAVAYKSAQLVKPKANAQAKGFKYVVDASKEQRVGGAAKMNTPVNKQFCSNCQFYMSPGTLDGSNDNKAAAKCPMLGNQVVPAKAWCNVWVKKS